jgi:hypothetical protein
MLLAMPVICENLFIEKIRLIGLRNLSLMGECLMMEKYLMDAFWYTDRLLDILVKCIIYIKCN